MSDLASVAQRIAARTWGGRWIAGETIDDHDDQDDQDAEERQEKAAA